MADVLFLVQRIPYPPTKGEKIRHYHFFRHLCQRHRVHLGCFIDDPDDVRHIATVGALATDACFITMNRTLGKAAALRALLSAAPVSLAYFGSLRLRRWVAQAMARVAPEVAVIGSSSMAQYVMNLSPRPPRLVVDYCDVDSEKWRAYAEKSAWPERVVYRREARRLLAFDRAVARTANASVFVSEAEAALFRKLAPESADKVFAVANGVDSDYFSPERFYDAPVEPGGPAFVFTGTMDYRPNVDAVVWFAEQALPFVRRVLPDARFFVVGSSPAPAVRALASLPGVLVTGRVPDVRPYLAHAAAAVAPLAIARGLQNKVLEAMAMARPVVVTPEALEGIDAVPGVELLVAQGPEAFAAAAIRATDPALGAALGEAARRRVVADHAWPARLAAFERLVEGGDRLGRGGAREALYPG